MGRVLKHYHYSNCNIVGLERSKVAIKQLQSEEPHYYILQGDVINLPFKDACFDVAMAFGLFHNIEDFDDLSLAISGTSRCLKTGGQFCFFHAPQ